MTSFTEEQLAQNYLSAMGDLREFLRMAKGYGELHTVQGASVEAEIGAIFELSNEHLYPPVLLFQDIPGFNPGFRVLSNVRTAKFIVGDLTMEALKAYRQRPQRSAPSIAPRYVTTGPILENALKDEAVNVRLFPAPRWQKEDGGHYIGTECLVITKDPDTDWVNVGTYRVMVQDDKTLSVFIEPGKHGDIIRKKYWAQGCPCPMAITVGQAPILGVVGAAAVKQGVSEFAAAGGMLNRPLDLVTLPKTGLPVPADAELAFEGFMPPPEEDSRLEGPFAEWPGYFGSEQALQPVMRVDAIYHRNEPIILGQPPLKPNYPGRQIRLAQVASLWNAIEAAGVPGVKGVWMMQGGGTRFIPVIAIEQHHPGHAKMAGLVAAGCYAGAYMARLVIVVEDDIDITNPAEVMWAVATRWDPKRQTDIIDDCWTGYIDPALPPEKRESGDITTSRMILYAVRPWHWKDKFPKTSAIDKDYAQQIREKWQNQLPFLRKS